PAALWTVVDSTSIKERLRAARETLNGLDRSTAGGAIQRLEIADVDLRLAQAEDELVVALRADNPEDAAAFAAQALATLEEAEIAPMPRSSPATLVGSTERRNLPTREARARAVATVAEYVKSNEVEGIAGPYWRAAFVALSSVELSDQPAFHRQLLIDLVRLADARASKHHIHMLTHVELVNVLTRTVADGDGIPSFEELVSSLQSGSQAGREAARAALAQVVDDTARDGRGIDPATAENLLLLVQVAFPRGSEVAERVLEALVGGLCGLATHQDGQIAARAQETLVAIHQPRDAAFWRRLAETPHLASRRIAFVGLSHVSVEEAFSYLREMIVTGSASLEEICDALREGLPAIDREDRASAQESFAEFLASVSAEERNQLVAVPAIVGLDWPAPPFERSLVRHFFAVLTRWRAFTHSKHDDSRAIALRDALGREVERRADEVLPLLEDEERRRLNYALTTEIHQPAAAAVCVPMLLTLGLETDLARSLVEATTADDEAWARAITWYFDVCPRDKLGDEQRSALLNALRAALEPQESTFLIGLAGRAAEVPREELRELIDNPKIDPHLRLELEMTMTKSYGTVTQELVAAASAGGPV
ncbi:MAG TPA: hypothetical protein VI111_06085, partial [Thermoleophilaceae bacterium]